MASEEITLAPCPRCSRLISIEAPKCAYCNLMITDMGEFTKHWMRREAQKMLRAARAQARNNQTVHDLWITETRNRDVIQTARVQGTNTLWVWISSNASKLRDLALFAIAAAYALGYIIWSIQALRNDLRLLPTIDSQYIITGLPPLIFLSIGITLLYLMYRSEQIGNRIAVFIFMLSIYIMPMTIYLFFRDFFNVNTGLCVTFLGCLVVNYELWLLISTLVFVLIIFGIQFVFRAFGSHVSLIYSPDYLENVVTASIAVFAVYF